MRFEKIEPTGEEQKGEQEGRQKREQEKENEKFYKGLKKDIEASNLPEEVKVEMERGLKMHEALDGEALGDAGVKGSINRYFDVAEKLADEFEETIKTKTSKEESTLGKEEKIRDEKQAIQKIWEKCVSWGDERQEELFCDKYCDETVYYDPLERGKDGGDSWYIMETDSSKIGCVIDTGGEGEEECYKKYFMSHAFRLIENLPSSEREEYIKQLNDEFQYIKEKSNGDVLSSMCLSRAELTEEDGERNLNLTVFGDAGVIIYKEGTPEENWEDRQIRACNLIQTDVTEEAEGTTGEDNYPQALLESEKFQDLDLKVNPLIGCIPSKFMGKPATNNIKLEEGEKAILFSDGVAWQEEDDGDKKQLILQEIKKYADGHYPGMSLEEVLKRFLSGQKRADDATFITLGADK